MKPSTKEWNAFRDSIGLFNGRRLKVDEHVVTIELRADKKKMQLYYEVFIDGSCKGEYLKNDSETGKRFLERIKIRKYKPNDLKAMEKAWGKKEFKKRFPDAKEMIMCGYTPYYKSFASLKKVLTDNNESIEILVEVAIQPSNHIAI